MSATTVAAPGAGRTTPARWVLTKLLRGYQLVVSPWVTQQCRYYPCCSSYALRAVEVHGAVRGSALAVRRLLRCHPWTPGGVDYVPGSAEALDFARREAESANTPIGAVDGAPSHQETVPCSTQS